MRRTRAFPLLFLTLVLLFSCRREEAELTLLERLNRIPGIAAIPIDPWAPGTSRFAECFQIDVTQPLDHSDRTRGVFQQRFYLAFRGEGAPTVFYTTGYGVARNYESEPAGLLQANQVLLVHRYFPYATPSLNVPAQEFWSHLTVAQAAGDQHEVREMLREILPGKWVSSGASKGGMTALFYRYFYPSDVEATIAYVAPIMERTDDPRFSAFIAQVGTADCRQKLRAFQREALERRAAMLALVHEHALQKGYSFTAFSEAEAFEYSVLEYPFAFWQYGDGDCAPVPGGEASDQELFDHLVAVSPLSYYADADYGYFRPLFYQAYTEIGYCPYVFSHLGGLLQAVPAPSYRAFAPRGVEMAFQPEVMQAVVPWLRGQGERILYIYGGNDPWTAGALGPSAGLDALQLVQPGANHGVKIRNLDQKGLAIAALERWLGIDIAETWLSLPATAEPRARL